MTPSPGRPWRREENRKYGELSIAYLQHASDRRQGALSTNQNIDSVKIIERIRRLNEKLSRMSWIKPEIESQSSTS